MCGVSACENRQNRVSHGESVRVGSSAICVNIPGNRAHADSDQSIYHPSI